jgi:hypothetical protein
MANSFRGSFLRSPTSRDSGGKSRELMPVVFTVAIHPIRSGGFAREELRLHGDNVNTTNVVYPESEFGSQSIDGIVDL